MLRTRIVCAALSVACLLGLCAGASAAQVESGSTYCFSAGDFSGEERCPIVSLNLRDYDSARVSDVLSEEYGIATRPGAHCAPLMHAALGTVEQGAVRFSFSHFNTMEEIDAAVSALRELAQEE